MTMLPAGEESRESSEDPIRLFDYEQDRVLKYSDIKNLTIIDPGLTIEDPEYDVQEEKAHLLRAEVQPVKDSAPVEQVMDKKFNKSVSSSNSNKRNNVDFKRNIGLIGMKIFQKDIIVHDNDNAKANTSRKNKKTNERVKDDLELDVYERIIGKAYENLKTCHKSLEEINACTMMDGKRPRKVCRSKSLYFPSVEKQTKSKNDVSISYKTPTTIEDINSRGCDKSYTHNLKNIEPTQNQNIETNSRRKGKHTTNKISYSIVSQHKKGADSKLIGYNNNVIFKRRILERKNDMNETIPSKQNIKVNIKNIDGTSNNCMKVTSINTTETKTTNSEKASGIKRPTNSQNIVSLAPKVAASISQMGRNTISSPCQIVKLAKPKSGKDMRVKKNFTNPNCNDQVAMSTVNAKITKSTNNEKAIEVKNKKSRTNCYDNVAVLSLGTNNIKMPYTERAKGMKRKIEDQDMSLVPKVAATISKMRRNTISSTCQIVETTKLTGSEKNIQTKRQLFYPNNNQATTSQVDAKTTESTYSKTDNEVKNKDNKVNCNDCVKVTSVNPMVSIAKANAMKRKINDQLSVSLAPKVPASISKIRRNTISSTCQKIKHMESNSTEKDMEEKRKLSNLHYDDQVIRSNVNGNMIKLTNSQKVMEVKNKNIEANCEDNITVSSIDKTGTKITNSEKGTLIKRKIDDKVTVSSSPKVAAYISNKRRNTISLTCQISEFTKPTKSEKDMEMKRMLFNPNYSNQITMSNINAKIIKPAHVEKAIEVKNKNNDDYCNDRLMTPSVDTNITKPNCSEKVSEFKRNIVKISIDDQVIDSFSFKKAACISKRRNTISSTCPENKSSLKMCDKSILYGKIIPHYHKIFLLDNGSESKNETDKRNVASELRLIRKKLHEEVQQKITQINVRSNEDDYKPHENYTNTISLTQSVPIPVGPNKDNHAIEPTKPIDVSLNLVPRFPLKPIPKYDMKISERNPHNLNKHINITDTEKITEVDKCDTIAHDRTVVSLHKASLSNQRSFNNFSPTFPIKSIVSSRPSQVFYTNNCLSPRSSHTSFSRSPGMRPRCAPYPSYSNYSNGTRGQYPILNRLLNARTFVGNPHTFRMLTQPPVFKQSQHYLPSPSRLNSPCSPSKDFITNNTSVKPTQQVVNSTDNTEQPTAYNKINKSLSESSAVQIVKTPEAKIINRPQNKSTDEVNVLNNDHKMSPTEQTSNENKCNESKKEYSPPILPILSYATIVSILEKSEYDYPLLKSRYKCTNWMDKETINKPGLDKNKSEINDGGTQDKKTKITLSEYKRRLSETSSGND